MIGLNHQTSSLNSETNSVTPRRRRTPSQYAESIRELSRTNERSKGTKKKLEEIDEESHITHQSGASATNALRCILPKTGRHLKLHVIIKKNVKTKISKLTPTPIAKKTIEKEQQRSENLLDVLFKLCEEQKLEYEVKGKEAPIKDDYGVCSLQELQIKDKKAKRVKESEDKYLKLFEKYEMLNEKLEVLETEGIIL